MSPTEIAMIVLRCVLAYRGGDIFRDDFTSEFGSPDDRSETFLAVGAALREVVVFLRDVAEIPHIKLLPYSNVVPVLVRYFRLHGAPRIYYSDYAADEIARYARRMSLKSWCIFDNTALGAATANALALARALA